jgi:hypothetical protein
MNLEAAIAKFAPIAATIALGFLSMSANLYLFYIRSDDHRNTPSHVTKKRIHPAQQVVAQLDFFLGTLAPFFRVSESPMAIACLRLFTAPPLPPLPERNVPRFL